MNFNPNIIEVFRWASSRPIHSVAIHGLRYKHLDIEMSLEFRVTVLKLSTSLDENCVAYPETVRFGRREV